MIIMKQNSYTCMIKCLIKVLIKTCSHKILPRSNFPIQPLDRVWRIREVVILQAELILQTRREAILLKAFILYYLRPFNTWYNVCRRYIDLDSRLSWVKTKMLVAKVESNLV